MSCFLFFSTVDTSLSKKKFSSHNDLTYTSAFPSFSSAFPSFSYYDGNQG